MKINPFQDQFQNLLFREKIAESTTPPPKRILICGNSQAGNGGTGQALEAIAKRNGWFVNRVFRNGMDTNGLLQTLKSYSPALAISFAYDVAIFFSGGANGSIDIQENAIQQILQLFPQKTMKFWMGVSPRTKDKSGNFDQANAFLREKSNVLLGNFVSKLCIFIDWKMLGLLGEKTPGTNISFPRLYDGIHLTGNAAVAAASGIWEHIAAAQKQAANVKQEVPFKASAKPVEAQIEKRQEKTPSENFIDPDADPDEEFALSDEQENYPFAGESEDETFDQTNPPSEEKIAENISSENNDESKVAEKVLSAGKKGKVAVISNIVYDAITKASRKHDVPEETMFAIACYESGFNPNAKSRFSGATGLFQYLGKYANFDRLDPYASADAAAKFLKGNLAIAKSFGQGDWFAYFCHQQGRYGASIVWKHAVEMKPLLSPTIINNLANNFGLDKEIKKAIFSESNVSNKWKLFAQAILQRRPQLQSEYDILPFFCNRIKARYESVKSYSNKSVERYLKLKSGK